MVDKDFKRVQDIISKAAWNRPEMIKLTVTQTKLITKGEKALARAHVAEEILGKSNIVAIIFYSRAFELGYHRGHLHKTP